MRLLLTGGSGFVGRSLAEALRSRGHEVLSPSRPELDLLDAAAVHAWLASAGVEAVVHAAVRTGETVVESTLRMQANLLRSLGRSYGRLLYFGSGAEYAKNRDLRKVSEAEVGAHVPVDGYGLAKLFLNEQARGRKRDVVNLRLFGVFGPYEGYLFKFISNAVAKALVGVPLTVQQDVRFDYLWIDDLVPVVEHFLTKPAEHADYNVTPRESITLSEIVDRVRELAGGALPCTFVNPGMNYEYTGSNERLASETAVRFTPMREAIERLWRHYEAGRGALDREALMKDDYSRRVKTRSHV